MKFSQEIMLCFKIGQPVAWAIMDTEDAITYKEFFKAIQARVPQAVIKVIMTDDGAVLL